MVMKWKGDDIYQTFPYLYYHTDWSITFITLFMDIYSFLWIRTYVAHLGTYTRGTLRFYRGVQAKF